MERGKFITFEGIEGVGKSTNMAYLEKELAGHGVDLLVTREPGGSALGERVRQLHTEALVWLRHPAHSQTLRSLLNRHHLADYQTAHEQAQHWLRRRGGRYGC